MAVDGKWELVINSPLGAQKMSIDVSGKNGVLTGTRSSPVGDVTIEKGKVEGDKISWSTNITSPSPMTLDFCGTVEADVLNGTVKAGSFGSFPFNGRRLG